MGRNERRWSRNHPQVPLRGGVSVRLFPDPSPLGVWKVGKSSSACRKHLTSLFDPTRASHRIASDPASSASSSAKPDFAPHRIHNVPLCRGLRANPDPQPVQPCAPRIVDGLLGARTEQHERAQPAFDLGPRGSDAGHRRICLSGIAYFRRWPFQCAPRNLPPHPARGLWLPSPVGRLDSRAR